MCERDVGLFSLVQQVIANVPWALQEGRVPVAYFGERTCYWTSCGYHDSDNVWEYYFEPVVPSFPSSCIPERVRSIIASKPPTAFEVGYFADGPTFVSAHFGDHPDLRGKALSIPYLLDDPSDGLRRKACGIIRDSVRPRAYIRESADRFFREHMEHRFVIGVHIRGTDAISKEEVRPHRQGSLRLPRYVEQIERLLKPQPEALIFVATDAQSSVDFVRDAFGDRVVACDSLRHEGGAAAGTGPTGWIMPAYIAGDRDRAARNGEEAVVDYLLLARCSCLVHNGSSLARTVLLKVPGMSHVNTHLRYSSAAV
jgi:hypothetical protein